MIKDNPGLPVGRSSDWAPSSRALCGKRTELWLLTCAIQAAPRTRLFGADGEPIGGPFFVSERFEERPDGAFAEARRPRIAWRDNTVVIIWESQNSDGTENRVVAARYFNIAPPVGGEGATLAIGMNEAGTQVTITWEGGGTLQRASTVNGTYEPVDGAASPYTVDIAAGEAYFQVTQ